MSYLAFMMPRPFAVRTFAWRHPIVETMMIDTPKLETEFLLRRAEEEAILAIRTHHPSAAAVHFDLSLRYGKRAREALIDDNAPGVIVAHRPPRQE